MVYVEEGRNSRRLIGFGLVVLLHVALIYALANGLGETVVEIVQGPMQATIVHEQTQPQAAPPPPPPPALTTPRQLDIRPPDLNITLPTQPAAPTTAPAQPVVSSPAPTNMTALRPDPAHPNRQPPYPPALQAMQAEGVVILEVLVGIDGRVHEATVKKSSGYPEFDQSALQEVLRSYRFIPAEDAGRPVASRGLLKIIFSQEEE